jgi:8-oxo-dGTP pyrophosphatase MutT (NUDIX family)
MTGTQTVPSIRQAIRSDLGAVMTYVISPTRCVLVKDTTKQNPRFKLPGGSIEDGEDVIAGAIREVKEETGIELSPTEVQWWYPEERKNGSYLPHFCVAKVTEEKLDTHVKNGDEDGVPIKVQIFDRTEVSLLSEKTVLYKHLPLILEAEKKLS